MLKLSLAQCQIVSAVLTALSAFFLFIGTVTPAWQVAEDLDIGRYVQSGLWLYCPGAAQCWYIFSDNLINYYEKVDVCRFFLIGDCRKKLLRTPYFFGWHYAVLILNMVTLGILSVAFVAAALAYFKKEKSRIATIVYDVFIVLSALFLTISLIVFVVNAEMLESKYLIGTKNTFEKTYGYSFYLACLALFIISFAMLSGVVLTTFTFFIQSDSERAGIRDDYRASLYYQDQPKVLLSPSLRESFAAESQTPLRSMTPMSQVPPLNVTHGEYIPPARSPRGDFQQNTRHFYSY
ncbi:unnamed protein product [Auanema sp. JU1783]|nr:unnamed protein product [Auanema sp. JU1783]